MKRQLLLFCCCLFTLSGIGQNVLGSWKGDLKYQGMTMSFGFKIEKGINELKVTMDFLGQGVKDAPVSSVSFENNQLIMEITEINFKYTGTLVNDTLIKGKLEQRGVIADLNLTRGEIILNRPQEPKPPYNYHVEDVVFENKAAGIKLAGTLTCPNIGESFPAVVLVTGSGAQNRDEEILGHKPFFVIADYFTRNGIAVLRYDDRGFAQSEGDRTSATTEDFSTDARAALNYLKTRSEIDSNKIGLVGHSEGGMIAFMLAAKYDDLSFIISMAGPGISIDSLMIMQRKMVFTNPQVYQQNELFLTLIEKVVDKYGVEEVRGNLDKYISEILPTALLLDEKGKTLLKGQIQACISPWMHYFTNYDPREDIKNVKCPVLALNGAKDVQVDADANLNSIKELLRDKVTVKKYPDLNHLFQHCKTGLPSEYDKIEETISKEVLEDMKDWILDVLK